MDDIYLNKSMGLMQEAIHEQISSYFWLYPQFILYLLVPIDFWDIPMFLQYLHMHNAYPI